MKKAIFLLLTILTLCVGTTAMAVSKLVLPEKTEVIETQAFYGTKLTEVVLPDSVRRIESQAFAYSQLKLINLPDQLIDIATDAFDQDVEFIVRENTPAYEWVYEHGYTVAGTSLRIIEISASKAEGSLTDTVTWTVTANDNSLVTSYTYTLLYNGKQIGYQEDSENPTYTAEITQAGTYQLNVLLKGKDGTTATGSSPLYTSGEILELNCPTALQAGQDLEIEIKEVAGAYRYSVLVIDPENGENLLFRTVTSPTTLTVAGYKLNKKQYEVYGYVFGKAYRYAIPTVRTVQVIGDKPTAPVPSISGIEDYGVDAKYSFTFDQSGFDNVAIHIKRQDWDNMYSLDRVNNVEDYFYERSTVSFSLYISKKWTEWSEEILIDRPEPLMLEAPEITCEESYPEGIDPVITIGNVDNAKEYYINFFEGNLLDAEWIEAREIYHTSARKSGAIALDHFGAVMIAGEYTLVVHAETDEGPYESKETRKLITITENSQRPAAPVVTTDRTQAGINSSIQFEIDTTDAERYYPKVTAIRPKGSENEYDFPTRDVQGNTSYFNTSWNEGYLGYTFHYSFAVKKNGLWSTFSEPLDILIVERESLAEAVIHQPDNPRGGQNLAISFDEVEHATRYVVRLYRGNERIDTDNFSDPLQTELVYNGRSIKEGAYRFEVTAYDDSDQYAKSVSTLEFQITIPMPAGPNVTPDKVESTADGNIQFTIDTTDFDAIYYRCTGYKNGKETVFWGSNTIIPWEETTILNDSLDMNGCDIDSVIYQFQASTGDTWSDITYVTISITATNNILDAPVFTSKDNFEAGEDLILSVEPISNAEFYHFTLLNKAGVNVHSISSQTPSTTIEGNRMTPGTYTIETIAHAQGYQESTAITSITIIGAKEPAPDITLESEIVTNGRSAVFTIDTSDADMAVVRSYRLGQTYSDYNRITVTGDSTEWKRTFNNATPGDRYGYAFAVRKNGKWTAWSATRVITITDQEPLAEPTIEYGELIAGKDLVISIGEVPNATAYYINLYKGDEFIRSNTYDGPVTVTIPGYRVDSGSDYHLTVTVSDSNGVYASTTVKEIFNVSGKRINPPDVTVSKQNDVLTNEQFTFSINATGAERVAMRYGVSYNNYGTRAMLDSECQWEKSEYSEGDYKYSFCVLQDGVWSDWCIPIHVYIQSGETLAKPELAIISGTNAGEDLVISIQKIPNAVSYHVRVYNEYEESIYSRTINDVENNITIQGYMLAAGNYHLQVTANPASSSSGFAASSSLLSFTITGSKPEAIKAESAVITLNPHYTDYWQITFNLPLDNAERLVSRSWIPGKANLSYIMYEDLSNIFTNVSVSSGSTRNYSFSVYKNGKWSSWSNAISITFDAE